MASLKQLIQAGFTTRQGKALLGLGGGGLKLSVPTPPHNYPPDTAYIDYEGDPWAIPQFPGGSPEWTYYGPDGDAGVFSYDAINHAIKLEKDALLSFEPEDSEINWQGATDTDQMPKQVLGAMNVLVPGATAWWQRQLYVDAVRAGHDVIETGSQLSLPNALRAQVPVGVYRAGTLITMRFAWVGNPSSALLSYSGLFVIALAYDPGSSAP